VTPETTLRQQSYTWVILIFSSQNNNHHHIRCTWNSDWLLNQPLIPPNSHENPMQHSQQGVSGPGKKKPSGPFSFLFFSPNKQKTEQQPESNSTTSWTANPWKTSLCSATVTKHHHFSQLAGSKAPWMNVHNEQVSITHHVWLSYSLPEKIIQHSPWTPNKQKWKT
jgi:hypothetical protein